MLLSGVPFQSHDENSVKNKTSFHFNKLTFGSIKIHLIYIIIIPRLLPGLFVEAKEDATHSVASWEVRELRPPSPRAS